MIKSLRQNALLKFLIYSSLTYLALYIIHQFIVRRYTLYDQKFIGTIINGADYILNLFGNETFHALQDRDYQLLGIDGTNGVWVGSNCNAISLFILFIVFIFWYPGNQKHKIWFIPFGILSIHLLNILRVVALTYIAKYFPEAIEFNHTYTFTFIVYAYIFALWLWWVNVFANKKSIKNEN